MQRAGFRTRGLPGLNAVESPGTELEPYVESVYPGATGRALSQRAGRAGFDERFSIAAAGRPDARRRRPRRADAAAGVGARRRAGRRPPAVGADRRLGRRPSRHRAAAADVGAAGHRRRAREGRRAPRPDDRTRSRSGWRRSSCCRRRAGSADVAAALLAGPDPCAGRPGRQRPDVVALAARAPRCGWPCAAKAAPHVSRRPFDDGDETALTVADEGRLTSTGWQVTDGVLVGSGTPSAGLRHYAVLGETTWDHVSSTPRSIRRAARPVSPWRWPGCRGWTARCSRWSTRRPASCGCSPGAAA